MRRRFLFVAAAALLHAGTARAQDIPRDLTVRGVVIGPDSKPVPGQIVVLHRVSAGGGATVAEDTASSDGRFELLAPTTPDTAAVYFVAGRYSDEMYLIPPFRAAEGGTDQILQVGVPGTSASAMLNPAAAEASAPAGRPATSRSWFLLAIPLFAAAAVALFILIPKARIPKDRATLIRIAEVDERMATAPDAQRVTLREERAGLVARLRRD